MQVRKSFQTTTYVIIPILFSLLGLTNCAKNEFDVEVPPATAVLATYQDQSFTVQDLMVAFQETATFNSLLTSDPVEEASRSITALCNTLAFNTYAAQEARKEGLHEKQEIREAYDAIVKDELYQRVLVEDVLKDIKITEDEIKQYYEENRDARFLIRNSNVFELRAVYTLFKNHSHEEARSLIEEAYRKLQQGINFYSVTRDYSDAPSHLRGKKSAYPVNGLAPRVVEALLQLQDGEYTDIIEQDHGFFIYERVSYRGPEYVKFENARSTILMELFEQEKNREALDLYRKLQEKFTLLVNRDVVSNAEIADASVVVLNVPGVYEITLQEFNELLDEQRTSQSREEFLDLLSQKALCLAEAYARGWSEKDVEIPVNYLFNQKLAAEYIISRIKPLDEENIRQFYQNNTNLPAFYTPRIYEVYRLFFQVPVVSGMNHFQELFLFQKAERKAEEVYNTLKQGLSFHDAIALFKGTTSDITISGGLVGHLPAHEMEPQTRSLVSPLEAGEIRRPERINNVSKNRYGYEIYYVQNIEPPQPLSYKEAEKVIRNQYQTGMFSQQQQQLMGEYLSKHAPEFQWDVLDKAVHYLVYLSTRPDKQVHITRFEEQESGT